MAKEPSPFDLIPIQRLDEDDPDFFDQVRCIATGCIDHYEPSEFYVIRIRDFFDYKWCYFSGKMMGAIGVSRFCDLTLPPFVPNRVLSQLHYERIEASRDVYKASPALPLHLHQRSAANFTRFIRRTTNDGTVIWLSSGSHVTGRGSMMVYHVTPDIKFGWHVSFLKKAGWQIDKVSFTSKAIIEALRDLGAAKAKRRIGAT
jgi:hypothetical protein